MSNKISFIWWACERWLRSPTLRSPPVLQTEVTVVKKTNVLRRSLDQRVAGHKRRTGQTVVRFDEHEDMLKVCHQVNNNTEEASTRSLFEGVNAEAILRNLRLKLNLRTNSWRCYFGSPSSKFLPATKGALWRMSVQKLKPQFYLHLHIEEAAMAGGASFQTGK